MRNILRTSEPQSGSNGRLISEDSSRSEMLTEELFMKQLGLERKRTERSSRRFVLMLLDPSRLVRGGAKEKALERILLALSPSIRETDIKGWYAESVVGVIFTEIGAADGTEVAKALLSKVTAVLCHALTIEDINEISLSFHVYPEDWNNGGPSDPDGSRLYGDLMRKMEGRKVSYALKRFIDVLGSVVALVLSSPLFVIIAAAIKLTSLP